MSITGSLIRRGALALLLASIVAGHGRQAWAQAPQAQKKPVAQPAPPPPPSAAPVVLPDPPTPVRQAQTIGLGACAPVLDLMARKTLTSPYDVQSGWSRTDPSRHIFQSIAALHTPANTPPDGFAALVAAPVTAGGCDGVAVQVFPLAGDCQNAQKLMLQGGQTLGPMMDARIMLDARGNRVILLPAYNNTCIAISVDTHFGIP